MSRFSDQVRDEFGREVPGVKVYVYIWDASATTAGALETLTADDATPLANPVTTDQFGEFFFNAPNGAKLLEFHFGGKLQYREQIQVGPIPSGPPGGPGALFGLFTNLPNITAGTETLIASSGYSVVDKGAAVYVYDASIDSAYVAAHPLSSGLTADAKGFRLSTEQDITPQMFGANGGADDLAAIQAAYAFAAAAKTELVIPGADYKVSAAVLFNVDGVNVRAVGWQKVRFLTTSATPALIVTSKYAVIKGIGCEGRPNGVTVTGTYGIVCKDANSTVFEDVDVRGFVNDGILLDTQFSGGTTGNNNQCRFKDTSSVQNGGWGVRMEQRADNNGISFDINASGNTLGGILAKSEGWYVAPSSLLEGNVGPGFQIGEDGDTSTNVNGIYDAPWNEGNSVGVHSSASAGSNLIRMKSGVTTYSRNAIAADTIEWIVGGVRHFGSNDGDAAVQLSANTTAAFVYASSKSGTANVTLHLGGAGTGLVQADTALSADGNLTANQNGSTLGGGRITRGSANGFFESFNPTGTRQGYGFFLNGTALQFDAEGTADHFEFLDPIDLTSTVLKVSGNQVVGARGAAVADGVAAVAAPTQAEFNAFVTQFNLLLARVRAATGHGLIS